MSINKNPLVSIIITNFNREKTVGKAIESALSQDYPNLEIMISDNCSTDNSHEVISKYINDNRVKYYRNEENIGMLANFIYIDFFVCNQLVTIEIHDNKYPEFGKGVSFASNCSVIGNNNIQVFDTISSGATIINKYIEKKQVVYRSDEGVLTIKRTQNLCFQKYFEIVNNSLKFKIFKISYL